MWESGRGNGVSDGTSAVRLSYLFGRWDGWPSFLLAKGAAR